jgi:hypothetical protein
VDMTQLPAVDAWGPHSPADCDGCIEAVDPVYVDEGHRVTVRQQDCRGQLLDFALIQERFVEGSWQVVVRIDCCHGEVHMHRMNASGLEFRRDVLLPITGQACVAEGYEKAERIVFDEWSENVRRCDRGR